MRMMKRVAVSILAAAMALSLMTACGGGDAPSAPETPSNPGTSQGEEKRTIAPAANRRTRKTTKRKTRPQRASRKTRKTKKWQMARRSNSTRAAPISGRWNIGLRKKYTSRWNR